MSNYTDKVQAAIDELIRCIKDTEEYKEFEQQKQNAKLNPAIEELIRKSQDIRYKLQMIPLQERDGDYADKLEQEYEDLCENTAVYNFTHAELSVCELFREILSDIIDAVDFE